MWNLVVPYLTTAHSGRAQKHRVLSTQKLAYRFINHTPSYSSSLQAFVRRFAGYKERGDSFPHLVEEEILQFFPQNFYRNHRVHIWLLRGLRYAVVIVAFKNEKKADQRREEKNATRRER